MRVARSTSAANQSNYLFNITEESDNHSTLDMQAANGISAIRLRTSGDSYFNGGNVGIGTTSPNDTLPLTLKSLASGATGIQFDDGDGNWNMVVDGDNMRFQQGTSGSNPIERMRIDSEGNVGIGDYDA